MTTITEPARILRTAFWQALSKPEEPGDVEWWNGVARGARDAAGAAYRYEGLPSAIHAAACYLEGEFWKRPDHLRWKPRDKAQHDADLPKFRAAAESFLTTLQRQRTAA